MNLDPDLIKGIVVTAITGFFGWIGARKISASTARKTDGDGARADFEALQKAWSEDNVRLRSELAGVKAELQAEIQGLRTRVVAAETQLDDEKRDNAALVDAIRMLLDWIERHFPDEIPPELPPRVQQRLTGH